MSMAESLHCEVFLVKSIQDKMAELLVRSPFLREEEQDILRKYTELLRTRSEEMIIFIQVMLKVKQELAYARLDLERAISNNMSVNIERRKVNWLSERLRKLSKLCHNYFNELNKELSKVTIFVDESSAFQFPSSTCKCGMMKSYIGEANIDFQDGVKAILHTSSDVLVHKRDSVQKIFKPPKPLCDLEILSEGAEFRVDVLKANMQPTDSLPTTSDHGIQNEKTSPLVIQRDKKSKLESLINYQNKALAQLLENLNNLYADDPISKVSFDSSTKSDTQQKENKESKNDGDVKETTDELVRVDDDNINSSAENAYARRISDDFGEDSVISMMLIPQNMENVVPKKEVYPRSPSVWCDYASCTSPVNYINLTSKSKEKEEDERSTEILAPLTNEKGVVLKRAVNRVKAITKLKIVRTLTDGELMKRKRIESLLGKAGIQSNNKNIAVDAAKALGELKCKDEEVISTLQSVISNDRRKQVKYECAKSLILLGDWYEEAMDVLTYHLMHGNMKIQEDILIALKKSQNAYFIPKSSPALISLSKALVDLLYEKDMNLSFNAALSLGYLCINHEKAKWLLLDSLAEDSYATKHEALNVLVKQMNCQENEVIDALLLQVSWANSWKHRMQAINLLSDIGVKRLNRYGLKKVFQVLEELLWNHSNKELRSKVVVVLDEFGLKKEAGANVLKRLNDKSESVRADAIVALTTLGMKGDRERKLLLDIFDLDSSTNVRCQVIRAFIELKWDHPHVVRVLEDRQKADDFLAKEASKAFNLLKSRSPKQVSLGTAL